MQLIDAHNAEAYLRQRGLLDPGERVAVTELAGGVSNLVLLVSRPAPGPDLVLKQAREQLRVDDPWFCSVQRIWREVDVLRICERLLSGSPAGCEAAPVRAPSVVFTDRDNYLFAMTAAPPHRVWKEQLLGGQADPAIAAACGRCLATLHSMTWQDVELARSLGDRTYFQDLRVDPYYRHVARQQADLQPALERLCRSLDEHCCALVHGDFSPKNLLVSDSGLMLVDFEVGHFGDPAFDLGFFLSHLVLKAIRAADGFEQYLQLTEQFWRAYQEPMKNRIGAAEMRSLERRAIENWAGCLVARVDGKSKVEYLGENQQALARALGRRMLLDTPKDWNEALSETRRHFVE